jgi:8-oxo-dGTP pyrophosphatase MutT (NUDIX family)
MNTGTKLWQQTEKYYRFQSGGIGIYEAVEKDCSRSDVRREVKPDGSWLPRVGEKYPGQISYWTQLGLEKYIGSRLQDWHRAVVNKPVTVQVCELKKGPTYSDEFQVISEKDDFLEIENLSINDFFLNKGNGGLVQKVAAYVTRRKNGRFELLVFRHVDFPDLGMQVPAGTIEPAESPEAAVIRELEEECGLKAKEPIKLGEYLFFKTYSQQYQHRHVFHLHQDRDLPDSWVHEVQSSGDDHNLKFEYSWQPIGAVDPKLILLEGIGDSLLTLERALIK